MFINAFFILSILSLSVFAKFSYIDELEAQMNIESAKDKRDSIKSNKKNDIDNILLYYNTITKPNQSKTTSELMIDQFIKTESKFLENITKKETPRFKSFLIDQSTIAVNYTPFTTYPLKISGTGPSPRRGYSSVAADTYMIIFGGCYMETTCYNDLYFLDLK